jgi:hypothetical protein
MPLRAQNRCLACNYTWHPRGKNLSLRCPACGSRQVTYAPGAAIGAAIGSGLVALCCLGVCVWALPRTATKEDGTRPAEKREEEQRPKVDKGKNDKRPQERPKLFTHDEVRDLVGRDRDEVRRVLGTPARVEQDGEFEIWRYEGISRRDEGEPTDRAATLRFGADGRLKDVGFD